MMIGRNLSERRNSCDLRTKPPKKKDATPMGSALQMKDTAAGGTAEGRSLQRSNSAHNVHDAMLSAASGECRRSSLCPPLPDCSHERKDSCIAPLRRSASRQNHRDAISVMDGLIRSNSFHPGSSAKNLLAQMRRGADRSDCASPRCDDY